MNWNTSRDHWSSRSLTRVNPSSQAPPFFFFEILPYRVGGCWWQHVTISQKKIRPLTCSILTVHLLKGMLSFSPCSLSAIRVTVMNVCVYVCVCVCVCVSVFELFAFILAPVVIAGIKRLWKSFKTKETRACLCACTCGCLFVHM